VSNGTTRHTTRPSARIAAAAQLACLLEARAPKPGNVSPGQPFHDMRHEDFVASAMAIGPVLLHAGERPLGETILAAIEATRRVTPVNTNLGIVLLLAPLVRAALRAPAGPLRDAVQREVEGTTIADAGHAYAAIRLAAPGGLGTVPEADVAGAPALSLAGAMRLAASRDAIAREWTTGYEVTFSVGAPALRQALGAGLGWADATTAAFLALLAHQPDTLVARKLGSNDAAAIQQQARMITPLGAGTPAWRQAVARLDASLRDEANRRNPGATADLTAAALFVVIIGRDFQPA